MTLSSAQTTNRQPAGGQLLPDLGALEDVLDLGRAVEGQLREALVHRAHDRQRVAPAVEEVGVAERDVAGAHADEALDVAQDRVGLHDADPPVVDGGDRAVPAAMRAAVAGLDVADQPLLAADRQPGVALEPGSSSRAGGSKVPRCRWMIGRSPAAAGACAAGQLVDPGHQRRLVLAGDHPRAELALDELAADGGVEPEEADRQRGCSRRTRRPALSARRMAVCIGTEKATACAQSSARRPTAAR